jgi:chloramphenicol-sensitive protein RarD
VNDPQQTRAGVAYGLGAFLWWGCVVFYFKSVDHVSPEEVLAHRVLWSALILWCLLAARGHLGSAVRTLRDGRRVAALAVTTLLVATNWFIFIWAVGHDRVLDTSMGYFINPLVNVLLGVVFLGERFRPLQAAGIVLAGVAVAVLWAHYGRVPLIALALAFSFGFYGLVRKTIKVEGVVGLAAETLLLTPAALAYLFYLDGDGALAFLHTGRVTDVLLVAAGVVTAVPLVWFINAARRLRYASVGLMQYIAPTMMFLIAVLVYHEPIDNTQILSFCLIWTAVGVYSIDSARVLARR